MGIELLAHRLNRRNAKPSFLSRQVWCVIDAYPMLMADGSAILHDGLGGSGFEAFPSLEGLLIGLGRSKYDGGIDARSLRVEVGEMGEHMDTLALLFEHTTQGGFDALHHPIYVLPVSGGL